MTSMAATTRKRTEWILELQPDRSASPLDRDEDGADAEEGACPGTGGMGCPASLMGLTEEVTVSPS
jgi:hypothetical protein